MTSQPLVHIAALYCFTPLADPAALRAPLAGICAEHGIKGTLLLAGEGLNGTIAGPREGLEAVLAHLRGLPGCAGLEVKFSAHRHMPFARMKVRLKREIVTMGVEGIDPRTSVGTYVASEAWNALIADPETVVIDTRNDYEVAIGSFAGAIDPHTASFREFPAWFRANREALLAGKRRVAMFCTGGIRCEKSTAFLKAEGVEEVYHLKGGILQYLEDTPPAQSLWQGECYVFDDRVSVGHGLVPGDYLPCEGCGRPVDREARNDPRYEPGVTCPACHATRDAADVARLRQRVAQRQHAGAGQV